MKYKCIVWDWNGTLFNDVEICLDSMNEMLKNNGYRRQLTLDEYKEIFSFPVREYYKRSGIVFDDKSFESYAAEFIHINNSMQNKAELYRGARAVLDFFSKENVKQYIISACESARLRNQMQAFDIEDYFERINGIEDHYAKSKAALAESCMKTIPENPSTILFIGDTVHDYEVARVLNCDCILIADGHQSRKRLEKSGAVVLDKLENLIEYLK